MLPPNLYAPLDFQGDETSRIIYHLSSALSIGNAVTSAVPMEPVLSQRLDGSPVCSESVERGEKQSRLLPPRHSDNTRDRGPRRRHALPRLELGNSRRRCPATGNVHSDLERAFSFL